MVETVEMEGEWRCSGRVQTSKQVETSFAELVPNSTTPTQTRARPDPTRQSPLICRRPARTQRTLSESGRARLVEFGRYVAVLSWRSRQRVPQSGDRQMRPLLSHVPSSVCLSVCVSVCVWVSVCDWHTRQSRKTEDEPIKIPFGGRGRYTWTQETMD